MKAIWIEQADVIEYDKFHTLGIEKIYVDIRPEYNPAQRVSQVRKQGFTAGVYWGARWGEENKTGAQHAKDISLMITDLENTWKASKDSLQCEFQLDFEDHLSEWMEDFLVTWRKGTLEGGKWVAARPTKVTSWTLESWQGGIFTWIRKNLVNLVNFDPNLLVVVQLYTGTMDTLVDSAAAYKNLRQMIMPDGTAGGIDESRLKGFYSAANFPHSGWDGFLFTNRSLA